MENQSQSNSIKIHFFYVVLILALIIIGLVTHKWTGIAEFREYLNVGATVTSLVLGVLAIIYSFVSSGQQSSVLGAVESAATTTSNSVAKLDVFMKSAQDLQAQATLRSNDLHTLTAALSDSVEGIKEETRSLVTANREIALKVSGLPDQLGELRGIIEKSDKLSLQAAPVPQNIGNKERSRQDIEHAIAFASMYGLVVLEAFVKAYELKKDVSLVKLSEAMGDSDTNYTWGFTVGFASTELVGVQDRKDQNLTFIISTIHPLFKSIVDAEWDRRENILTEPEAKAHLLANRPHALSALVDPVAT